MTTTDSNQGFLDAFKSTIETFKNPFGNMESSSDFPTDMETDKSTENEFSMVSYEVARLFSLVIIVGICTALCLFGMASNVLNMVVFLKQGFQDTVNMSFFAISFSDLLSSFTLLWLAISQNPLMEKAELPFFPAEIEVLISGIPHAIFMNSTGLLTAFVAFERCVCVVYPLKVKDIITRGRTKFIVVASFLLAIGGQIPSYYCLRLDWRFVPERNETVVGITTVEGSDKIEEINFYIVNVSGPLLTFFTVLTCSAVLIVSLNMKSKWRLASSAQGKSSEEVEKTITMTTRDWKVVKMVAIVSMVFVLSFTPYVLISIIMASEPKFRFYREYHEAFAISVSIGSLLEAINANSNVFIYYTMSSKFKVMFRATFCGSDDTVRQTKLGHSS